MTDTEDWAARIAVALGTKAGSAVIDWLRHRSAQAADAAETLTANPDDDMAKTKLANSLELELASHPSLAAELRDLLDRAGTHYGAQNAKARDGGIVIQIQGNRNRV